MKLPTNAKLVESGVDWLTVTASDRDNRQNLRRVGESIIKEAVVQGDDVSSFSWKGFEGIRVAECDVAERYDCTMVRLYGYTARYQWWDAAQFAQNCSRIDYQQTWSMDHEPVEKVLARCFASVKRTKLYGKPVKWHYRRDIDKGNTIELGRRSSDQFGRVYNKEVQSKLEDYAGCMRLEVEFKNELALVHMRRLGSGVSCYDWLNSQVCAFFRVRGIVPPMARDHADILVRRRRTTDMDRYLTWLSKSVRVGVQRAIAARGVDAVVIALGLVGHVQANGVGPQSGPIDGKGGKDNGSVQSSIDRISDRSDA